MKNIKWKLITIIGLLVILLISMGINYHQRNQRDKMIEHITRLNTLNEQLRLQVEGRDKLIENRLQYIQTIEDSLIVVKGELSNLKDQYKQLEGDYEDLQDEVNNIPPEESYAFLRNVAYPFSGELKYPFNELQVQGMHLTYIQKNQQDYMIGNLKSQVDVCQKEVGLHEMTNKELKGVISDMEDTRADLEQIIDNKDEEIKIHNREVRRQKRRKVLYQITTVIAVGAAVIL